MINTSVYYTQATNFMGTYTDGVAVSSTTTYYSIPWMSDDGQGTDCRAVGTMTGTWSLWYSGKAHPDLTSDSDWHQDTAFSPTNPAGADAKFLDETGNSKVRWKRLKYVNASGTGTIYAYVTHPSAV